jgi:DNA-binding SARP family transcriptional activator
MTTVLQTPARVVELSLIRDFEVRCDGEPVVIAPASQRLLSFLALQPRPVRRAHVSGTLWFDADEQHASASLRSALWRLNALDLVCASKTHISLHPSVEVDLHRAIGCALGVLRSPPSDDSLLAMAQELIDVGDDLLVGWYDDWVIVERERFRQVRLHAMDRIGERLIELGRWYDALQVGLAATSAEPLRESSQRLLVRVHLLQGNIAEAIRQYRSYAELLRVELNGRPSQGIRDLLAPFVRSATA